MMQPIAIGEVVKDLEELVYRVSKSHEGHGLADAFLHILEKMQRRSLRGTLEEAQLLARKIREDAAGLRLARDTRVLRALEHVERKVIYVPPVAKGRSALATDYPNGIRTPL